MRHHTFLTRTRHALDTDISPEESFLDQCRFVAVNSLNLARLCLGILVLALATHSVRADEPSSIRVLAQVPRKPYYVGQAVELRIGAEAAGERPEVDPPVIPGTDVALIDKALSPVAASG